MFGDRAARWDDLGLDHPTVSLGAGCASAAGSTSRSSTGDGAHELRQLEFWGGRVPFDDPLELESVRVAVLRLTPLDR